MTTFIGDYQCKADAKGRIVLPAAFKKQMPGDADNRFVVRKDIFENCLVLYPIDEWERQNELIRQNLNPYNREHNLFLRKFYKGTAELVMDVNNRLLVPKKLFEIVGIEKEVYLAGQDRRIEIWAKDKYEQIDENDFDFAAKAEEFLGGGLEL